MDEKTHRIVKIGAPLSPHDPLNAVPSVEGAVPVFPIREDGLHMNWGLTGPSLQRTLDQGYVRVTRGSHAQQPFTIAYLTAQNIEKVNSGEYQITGTRLDGSPIVVVPGGKAKRPTTAWREARHDAGAYGTSLTGALLPGRKFPFPKSLYAVEDTLRLFVHDKPDAVILDFFAGSGTTAHAAARLNRQDGGRRRSISVTNNEVGEDEALALRAHGHNPGDPEWEAVGIFEHITRPRITASITGRTPDGQPVQGTYTHTDEFPMADGFGENVELFDLIYLDAPAVDARLAFARIAPLLWLRAGAAGPVIHECADQDGTQECFEWTSQYGVLFDADEWRPFVASRPDTATTAFIVTNSYTQFAHIAGELPGYLDVVRLYERYLATFAVHGR